MPGSLLPAAPTGTDQSRDAVRRPSNDLGASLAKPVPHVGRVAQAVRAFACGWQGWEDPVNCGLVRGEAFGSLISARQERQHRPPPNDFALLAPEPESGLNMLRCVVYEFEHLFAVF